jgi:hypothetical protein
LSLGDRAMGSVHDEPYYRELSELVLRNQRCIAFVGSGLSIEQYLSWQDLIYRCARLAVSPMLRRR